MRRAQGGPGHGRTEVGEARPCSSGPAGAVPGAYVAACIDRLRCDPEADLARRSGSKAGRPPREVLVIHRLSRLVDSGEAGGKRYESEASMERTRSKLG